MTADRRSFLRGALMGAGATAAGVAGLGASTPAAQAQSDTPQFHGAHQTGILRKPPPAHIAVAFDVLAENRKELDELFRTITDRTRILTTGGTPDPVGITGPPPDNGIIGPSVPSGGLMSTVGVGASLFDDRYGLADKKPARLKPMPTFPDDDLDPKQCHGDLSIWLAADSTDVTLHALRDITRHTRGGMQIRWRINGFSSPPRPHGTQRNLLGFKDGISNPDVKSAKEMDKRVWVDGKGDEPAWTKGGSYQVLRFIRMLVEFWDRVSISEQETMFGRSKDTGAPLDGAHENDTPDFVKDPVGDVISLTSHIRLANPRTPQTDGSRILRRAVNYDRGVDDNGNLDMGLIFASYQRDLVAQFEATQHRLEGEPLTDYISPFGGGYFFALPGVTGPQDHFGRTLLA